MGSGSLGFSVPKDGDSQHLLWEQILCHFLGPLEPAGTWSCYHGAKKEIILVIAGETCLAWKSLC